MGLIRLFLAYVVLADHIRITILFPAKVDVADWAELGMNAGRAVFFFYVISGFLISYVLSTKYSPDRRGTYNFYKSRFVRIYSLYWPLYALIVLLNLVGGWEDFATKGVLDRTLSVILFGSDWQVAFASYPEQHWEIFPPALRVAWSLGAEVTFYAAAPFLLRRPAVCLAMFATSAAVRAALVAAYGFNETWTYHFFPTALMFFLMGHFAQKLSARWGFSIVLGATALTISVASSIVSAAHSFDSVGFYVSIVAFAVALPSIFRVTKDHRLLNRLGDFSYPLYLVHPTIVISLATWGHAGDRVQELANRMGGEAASTIFVLGIAILAVLCAGAVFFIIERPVAQLMRFGISAIEPAKILTGG